MLFIELMPSKNIALVGMPGGGKSTIGRQLARRLNCPFHDSDSVIEKKIGQSIRSFFEQEGEAPFRRIETEVIAALATTGLTVVATGGGAVLSEANRHVLHDQFHVVYLRSTPEELFRRLKNDTQRPLLQVKEPLAQLKKLYAERDPLYRKVAHFVVETGRPSVGSLVNILMMQLELAGIVGGRAEDVPPQSQR
jgi:shikimate kinase